ncbi:hypothetical protein LTR94_029075, partial [Friedmanniomyces endolithicus]
RRQLRRGGLARRRRGDASRRQAGGGRRRSRTAGARQRGRRHPFPDGGARRTGASALHSDDSQRARRRYSCVHRRCREGDRAHLHHRQSRAGEGDGRHRPAAVALRVSGSVPVDAARQRAGRSADRQWRVPRPADRQCRQPARPCRRGGCGAQPAGDRDHPVAFRRCRAGGGHGAPARERARVGHRQPQRQQPGGGRFRRQRPARARSGAPDRHRHVVDARHRASQRARKRRGDRVAGAGGRWG